MATPAITWPQTTGDTVYTSNVPFDWAHNDTTVYGWQLYVGTTTGDNSLFDSGILEPTQYGVMAQGMPADGTTIYVRLRWNTGGAWSTADTTYISSASNQPGHTYSRWFDWFSNERWWQCERCGFLFPESDTAIDPKSGKRVCIIGPRDYDDHEFGIFEKAITGRRTPFFKERD